MQRSFSDLKYWAVRRLEQFLRKMNAAMPWSELLAVLKPYHPTKTENNGLTGNN